MISILYSILLFFHPLHISVTEIEYNEKANSLQIISRIFVDDLEVSIQNQTGNTSLDLLKPAGGLTTKGLVENYLKEHFKIRLDDKEQKMNFLGFEEENFALICYIEIENIKKFKKIEVENSVITETYDDQSNLVHVTYLGPVKSMRLMREKTSDTFTF